MSCVLGIDGGGSKCTAALSDGRTLVGTHTAGGCNLNTVSGESARLALGEAVGGALLSAGVSASSVSSVCAGVAGAAAPKVAGTITDILAELLPHAAIQVVTDSVITLEAAFPGRPGVVCISGTGSIAFGRNGRGECTRAGGWGRMVSDEGSGHWIGLQAVSQCLRALDLGRSSQLIAAIMEHWQVVTREHLVQRCHRDPIPDFAELFPVVLGTAEAGDALANEILSSAGTELAHIAQIILRRLWASPSNVEVAITGGVFVNSARVRHIFGNVIRSDRPEVHVRLSQHQAFEGALYLAQQTLVGSAAD